MKPDLKAGVARVLTAVDLRLVDSVRATFENALYRQVPPLEDQDRWVLAGHRAAGKSTLLPLIAQLTQRPALDLDAELERQRGESIRPWFARDPSGFRNAEREAWRALPERVLVAVGGGFLSNHPDLLRDAVVVLVPVSFETYRERLMADVSRPRLWPGLSIEEEIRVTFDDREKAHAQVRTLPLGEALAALVSGGAP